MVTPSFFKSSTSDSKLATLKFIIKSFFDGSKYLVAWAKGAHWVLPFLVESDSSLHSNEAPYSLVFSPRWVLYHSFIFLGSSHLKKIPPIPVTFFIFWLSFFVVIALSEKPRQKVAAHTSANINGCFMVLTNFKKRYQ